MQIADCLPHALMGFLKDESGASYMEYALLGSLIIMVCTLVLIALNKHR